MLRLLPILAAGLVAANLADAQPVAHDAEIQRLAEESRAQTNQQHFDTALQLAEQAIAIGRSAGDKQGLAVALYRLSLVSFYARKLEAAVDAARQSEALAAEVGDDRVRAYAAMATADPLRDLGRLEEARVCYQRTLDLFKSAGDRRGEASALRMSAVFYRQSGDTARALDLARKSLAISREIRDASIEGPALFILGVIESESKLDDAALEHYEAALANPSVSLAMRGQILQGLGTIYCNRGQFGRCTELYRQQLEMAVAAQNEFQIAWGYFKLGYPLGLAGAHADAYESNLKALTHLRSTDHSPYDEWHFLAAVGQELQHLGRDREAAPYYEEAIGIVERLRQGLVPTEEARANAASETLTKELFDSAIDASYTFDPSRALRIAELGRARAFLSILAESKIDLRKDLSASDRDREAAIFGRIAAIQRGLWRPDLSAAAKRQKAAELESAESDLERFQLELRRSNPRMAAVHYPQPLGLEQIQRDVVKPGTTLLEYSLGTKRSFVWAISHDRATSAVLPAADKIEALVSDLRAKLNAAVSGLTLRQANLNTARSAARLYEVLLKPIEGFLDGSQTLIIVPDGAVYYVPFEALVAPGKPGYLLERFSMAYAPSATSLADSVTPKDLSMTLLAFGDPSYGKGPDLGPLAYTRDEVVGIASLFPKDRSAVFLGAAAREEAVKTAALERYRYIHFATHGILDEAHPARSGLALTAGGAEDGVLQVDEIAGLRLQADVVTLSACSTGLGKLVSGEGMLGLVRAFLYAGASSVAVSLWNVNDAATADLMKEFYRQLSLGAPAPEALRRAKLRLLHQREPVWSHPHYWAPFVLWLR